MIQGDGYVLFSIEYDQLFLRIGIPRPKDLILAKTDDLFVHPAHGRKMTTRRQRTAMRLLIMKQKSVHSTRGAFEPSFTKILWQIPGGRIQLSKSTLDVTPYAPG